MRERRAVALKAIFITGSVCGQASFWKPPLAKCKHYTKNSL
jgi:hypothetical protein